MNFLGVVGVTFLLLCFVSLESNARSVVFVDKSATGNNTGDSWQNAINHLQDAIECSKPGDEIWIADGIYYPNDGVVGEPTSAERNFAIFKSRLCLRGGFAGYETEPSARQFGGVGTILSGDLGMDDVLDLDGVLAKDRDSRRGSNALYGLRVERVSDLILDGIVFTGASSVLSLDAVAAKIVNCRFHPAGASYGLVCWGECDVSVEGCQFTGECTNLFSISSSGRADIRDSSFSSTNYGRGINTFTQNLTVDRCYFLGCRSLVGAAVKFSEGGEGTFSNCLFAGNYAAGSGSVCFFEDDGRPVFRNCSFVSNLSGASTDPDGLRKGGVFYGRDRDSPVLTVENSIIWDNQDLGTLRHPVFNGDPEQIIFKNCIIQDSQGWGGDPFLSEFMDGGGNLDADPLFVSPIGEPTSEPVSLEGLDAKLSSGSPAINRLDDIDVGIADLDRRRRVQNGFLDLGAFEFGTIKPIIPLFEIPVHRESVSLDGFSLQEDPDGDGMSSEVELAFGLDPARTSRFPSTVSVIEIQRKRYAALTFPADRNASEEYEWILQQASTLSHCSQEWLNVTTSSSGTHDYIGSGSREVGRIYSALSPIDSTTTQRYYRVIPRRK